MGYRRELALSAEDTEYLDNAFPAWESIAQGSWLILPDFPLPDGYTVRFVTVAIQISAGYPFTPLDMAYFFPPVLRIDGTPIPATNCTQNIDGNTFQRWSRHYPPGTWRPDEDCIATHVMAIQSWLELASGALDARAG